MRGRFRRLIYGCEEFLQSPVSEARPGAPAQSASLRRIAGRAVSHYVLHIRRICNARNHATLNIRANKQRYRRLRLQAIQRTRRNIPLRPQKIRPIQMNTNIDRTCMTGGDSLQLFSKRFAMQIGFIRIDAHLDHLPDLLFQWHRGIRRSGALRRGICAKPENASNPKACKETTVPHLNHPPAIGAPRSPKARDQGHPPVLCHSSLVTSLSLRYLTFPIAIQAITIIRKNWLKPSRPIDANFSLRLLSVANHTRWSKKIRTAKSDAG